MRCAPSRDAQPLKRAEDILSVRAHQVGARTEGKGVAPIRTTRPRERATLALPEAAVAVPLERAERRGEEPPLGALVGAPVAAANVLKLEHSD